jgi:hypothetical protein
MSEPQGIEQPPPPPPYTPGDTIYDLVAGAAYPVLECHPIGPLLAGATRANWQVIFELPTEGKDPMYAFVDDDGYTPAHIFGPHPAEQNLDQLLAEFDGADL